MWGAFAAGKRKIAASRRCFKPRKAPGAVFHFLVGHYSQMSFRAFLLTVLVNISGNPALKWKCKPEKKSWWKQLCSLWSPSGLLPVFKISFSLLVQMKVTSVACGPPTGKVGPTRHGLLFLLHSKILQVYLTIFFYISFFSPRRQKDPSL